MKKILITGATGASGQALFQYLTTIYNNNDQPAQFFLAGFGHVVTLDCPVLYVDLSHKENVVSMLKDIEPDEIYHLAGSFTQDFAIDFKNNVQATEFILDFLARHLPNTKMLVVGSASEYGYIHANQNPIKEDFLPNPESVYGLTKLYQTQLAQFYHKRYDTNVVIARLFNLYGKGISPKLLAGRLFQQIEDFKAKKIKHFTFGGLNDSRDYISLSQMAQHYHLLMQKGKAGEIYNVGAGEPIKLYDFVQKMLHEHHIFGAKIEIEYFAHKNLPIIYADIQKLKELNTHLVESTEILNEKRRK